MVKRCTSFIANDVHLSGIKMCIFYFNIFLEGFFVLGSTLLCLSRFIDAKIQNLGGNVKGSYNIFLSLSKKIGVGLEPTLTIYLSTNKLM